MREKIKAVSLALLDELRNPYYQAGASQLAFFLFLSVLPIVTFTSKMLGLFDLSLEDIFEWAHINLQDITTDTLSVYFAGSNNGSSGISFVLIITTLWAASKAQFSLTKISDYAMRRSPDDRQSPIKERIRAYIIILCVIILIVLVIVGLIYAPNIFDLLFKGNPPIHLPFGFYIGLRWIVVFVLYLIFISVVYMWSPTNRLRFKEVIPGSIFSSIGLLLVSFICSLYVKYSISTSFIYGSLSSIVVLMLWFWLFSWIVCIGVILNKKFMELDMILW